MTAKSCLYAGTVYHKRHAPRKHALRYSVFSMLLDLDELPELHRRHWIFSYNRFNLLSFYDRDFGESIAGESLSEYVSRKLCESGIHTMPTRILLSCYPRVLGYVFNPLSLFYCIDENGRCYAVVHEVHNTFAERHAYVLPVKQNPADEIHEQPAGPTKQRPLFSENDRRWIHQRAHKQLFVSPFAHMDMNYQFRLNIPDDQQIIVIEACDDSGPLITAGYCATRYPFNNGRMLRFFLTIPLLSVKVITAIHWEALRLWLKGIPMFRHRPKRQTRQSH